MSKFFNPEDYILSRVNAYPSLYASRDYDETKFKVLDQLFNVIGNGVRDDEELAHELRAFEFDRTRAEKILAGERAYYGYYHYRMIGSYKMGEGDFVTALECEQINYPDVVLWNECRTPHERSDIMEKLGEPPYRVSPYPNFQAQYSLIDQTNIKDYGPEWAEAIVWFYTKCREYFNGDHSNYHSAFPCDTKAKTQRLVDDLTKYREKYESDEKFAEAYMGRGAKYDGNMYDFCVNRWQITLKETMAYIEKAITEFSA